MDLLRCKFSLLSCEEKATLTLAADRARQESHAARKAALAKPRVHDDTVEVAPTAVGNCTSGCEGLLDAAEGDHTVWLPMRVPAAAVPLLGSPVNDLAPTVSPIVRRLAWTDPASHWQKVYEVIDGAVLGAGVYGTCQRVKEVSTGEVLCAKFASVNALGDESRTALCSDFSAMSMMNHPNVMRPIALIVNPGLHPDAMLMPIMSSNLREWIEVGCDRRANVGATIASEASEGILASKVSGDSLTFDERSCLLQVASGIAHIHNKKLFHLDIKPENILVDLSRGPPIFLISDFGNCEALDTIFGVPSSGMVRASYVNSPQYRPFELLQYNSRVPLTSRFDVWAFGCLIFDVAQVHPRQRGQPMRLFRLMGGIDLDHCSQNVLWSSRNSRINAYARKGVRSLIAALQPKSTARKDQVRATALDGMLRALRVCG